ncbi:hypothetical protein T05_4076 [Trichinella murrelli]|uniref:Uncharacterized protein n=1 Tax=Trichinella murrelli TaxID=144512 RepID=A0A0V0TB93_9BILA|nr:hypothetical protein T05_4076 [Trichinella murrelli]
MLGSFLCFQKKIPTIVSRQRIVPSGWVEMFASRRQWFSFYHGHSAALAAVLLASPRLDPVEPSSFDRQ